MDDAQFRKLLNYLNLSWEGYRSVRKGVKKRLTRHMQQIGCGDANDYLDRIRAEKEILRETRLHMAVSISSFFRDRLLWNILEEKLIPEILSRNPDRVHVWSAGSALGQEVYSIKILWHTMEKKLGLLPPIHILATDVHPEYHKRAMEGIYNSHAVRGIQQDILETLFHRVEDQYAVSDHVKTNISWEISDLTKLPHYPNRFQIIFLRNNLLTYYKQEIKETAFPGIMNNLADGGYLIIGVRESLPYEYPCLSRRTDCPCIFRKT
jgi:chemotaxis protein methyltransferase CheR